MKFPRPSAKFVARAVIGLVLFLAAIQFIPYGRNHTNPPVLREPAWNSPQTREVFFRACKNCHSNETVWPWYANVAPFSWLVRSDVNEGRSNLNVSEWGLRRYKGYKAAGEVREWDMPPLYYLPLHPEAWLSKAERAKFAAGLINTFGDEPGRTKTVSAAVLRRGTDSSNHGQSGKFRRTSLNLL